MVDLTSKELAKMVDEWVSKGNTIKNLDTPEYIQAIDLSRVATAYQLNLLVKLASEYKIPVTKSRLCCITIKRATSLLDEVLNKLYPDSDEYFFIDSIKHKVLNYSGRAIV